MIVKCRWQHYALLTVALLTSAPVLAVDGWKINQIFINTDGDSQYIELKTNVDGQQSLAGLSLQSISADGSETNTFVFPTDLPSSQTAGRSVLIGTTAFSALTQLATDYELPPKFLFADGGTVRFSGIDSLTVQRERLPRNGLQAYSADGTAILANPKNFASQSSMIEVPGPAVFDTRTAVLELPEVDVAGAGIANASLQLIQEEPFLFQLIDGYFYDGSIIRGNSAATLADNILLIPGVRVGPERYGIKMTLLDDQIFLFGNLEVMSVSMEPELPQLPVRPQPAPNLMTLSITAGKNQYAAQCASCHGPRGYDTVNSAWPSSALRQFDPLRTYINNRMPLGNASRCIDSASSSCATDIANFIISGLPSTTNQEDFGYSGEGGY
jgi:cytochrome c553